MGQSLRLLALVALILTNTALAATKGLSVFTSDNPQSNAVQSFIVVPYRYEISHGISRPEIQPNLTKQLPFRIELLDRVSRQQKIQWSITITKNSFGRIRIRSSYSGTNKIGESSTKWTSNKLDDAVKDRKVLLFQPRPQKHLPRFYKMGKPVSSRATSNGGGTKFIDVEERNPRLTYEVEARIFDAKGKIIQKYKTKLQMDNRDLIRQEYINHYKIRPSTAGEAGRLPVPGRDEIRVIPPRPQGYAGNSLTESNYGLIIEDGAIGLSKLILDAYEQMKSFYQKPGNAFLDLNGNPLAIPDSRLWLSSGWRNPELNEWFSPAVNDAHQLGAALDIMPNEIPRKKEAAIVYWVLWRAIESIPDRHRYFAQLQALKAPLRKSSFKLDIEPKNGIPDAFDKADHLHINLIK